MTPNLLLLTAFLIGMLIGAALVFVYLHKHTTAAIAAATNLAATVAQAKADLQTVKNLAGKVGA